MNSHRVRSRRKKPKRRHHPGRSRQRCYTPIERLDQIQEGLARGHSQRAIARMMGVDEGTVRRDLKKFGLTPAELDAIRAGAPAEPFLIRARINYARHLQSVRIAEEQRDSRHSEALKDELLLILNRHNLCRADEMKIAEAADRKNWKQYVSSCVPRTNMERARQTSRPGPLPKEMFERIDYLVQWLVHFAVLRYPERLIRDEAFRKLVAAVDTPDRRPVARSRPFTIRMIQVPRRKF